MPLQETREAYYKEDSNQACMQRDIKERKRDATEQSECRHVQRKRRITDAATGQKKKQKGNEKEHQQ